MKQSDFAHREILRQITELELAPGTPLREVAVAESLGLSRTPVREALQRLVREGVATVVGRSVVVSRPTIRDLTEVYQAREAIEGYATALCAAHSPDIFKDLAERFAMFETLARDTDLSGKSSDPDGEYALLLSDLDQAIIDNCGNSRLTTLLSNIWTEARRIRLIVLTGGGFDRVRESATEHREICHARKRATRVTNDNRTPSSKLYQRHQECPAETIRYPVHEPTFGRKPREVSRPAIAARWRSHLRTVRHLWGVIR